MNPIYETVTAVEAAQLWNLEKSTVRRAIWEGRLTGRKSSKVNLVALTEMRQTYGEMPHDNACDFIINELTQEDIERWHNDSEATPNVTDLMQAVGVDCIQIWGGFSGDEPVTVTIC